MLRFQSLFNDINDMAPTSDNFRDTCVSAAISMQIPNGLLFHQVRSIDDAGALCLVYSSYVH